MKDNRVTNSQVNCYNQCKRKHYLRYVLGITTPGTGKALRMGSAFHDILDMVYSGVPFDDAILAMTSAHYESLDGSYDLEIEMVGVTAMAKAYFWRWAEMDKDITVLESEEQFNMTVLNPKGNPLRGLRVAGMIDRIFEIGGRVVLHENKTTSESIDSSASYWKPLTIDPQISLYWICAKRNGYDVKTCLYDVTKKPTMKPRTIPVLDASGCKQVLTESGERVYLETGKGDKPRQGPRKEMGESLVERKESPDEYGQRVVDEYIKNYPRYFVRKEIPRTDRDLEQFTIEFNQLIQELRLSLRHRSWPKNRGACTQYGTCPFMSICSSGLSILELEEQVKSGLVPAGYIIGSSTHPELDGE